MSGGELFLPAGYRENPPATVGESGVDYWADPDETATRDRRRYQDRVYRFAARRARRDRASVVVDVGCGTGLNLVTHLAPVVPRAVGVDQLGAIAITRETFPDHMWLDGDLRSDAVWGQLAELRPDLVVCADVIEHVADPLELLSRLHRLTGARGTLVLSTPDRSRLEGQDPLGPPRNPKHVREWTFPEMQRLLRGAGFTIRAAQHVLPRRYPASLLEAKILAWRALHGRALPDRRSCMVFDLAPS